MRIESTSHPKTPISVLPMEDHYGLNSNYDTNDATKDASTVFSQQFEIDWHDLEPNIRNNKTKWGTPFENDSTNNKFTQDSRPQKNQNNLPLKHHSAFPHTLAHTSLSRIFSHHKLHYSGSLVTFPPVRESSSRCSRELIIRLLHIRQLQANYAPQSSLQRSQSTMTSSTLIRTTMPYTADTSQRRYWETEAQSSVISLKQARTYSQEQTIWLFW